MTTLGKRKGWNWFKNNEAEGSSLMAPQLMAPWRNPVSSLSQLQRNIEQVFDSTARGFGWPVLTGMPTLWSMPAAFQPRVNIASNDDQYTITLETPGMEEKDVKLDVSPEGELTISGEKKHENEERIQDYECVECSYGAFQRSFSLPDDVDLESIEARFKNGVLTITCPRAETSKSHRRQIPIGEGRRGEGRGTPERESVRPAAPGPRKAA